MPGASGDVQPPSSVWAVFKKLMALVRADTKSLAFGPMSSATTVATNRLKHVSEVMRGFIRRLSIQDVRRTRWPGEWYPHIHCHPTLYHARKMSPQLVRSIIRRNPTQLMWRAGCDTDSRPNSAPRPPLMMKESTTRRKLRHARRKAERFIAKAQRCRGPQSR